jgi:hypothetical protein
MRWRKLEKKDWKGLLRARLGPAGSGTEDCAGRGSGRGTGALFEGSLPF